MEVDEYGSWIGLEDTESHCFTQIQDGNISIGHVHQAGQRFATPFDDWWQERLTPREISMLRLINDLTESSDWRNYAFDQDQIRSWEQAALQREHINQQAWEWCLEEIRDKVSTGQSQQLKERTDFVTVFDSASKICKSDILLDSDSCPGPVLAKLQTLMQRYPAGISPWMNPLRYGYTRIITEDQISVSALNDSRQQIGKGSPTKKIICRRDPGSPRINLFASFKYQWIPCQVEFFFDPTHSVSITSPVFSANDTIADDMTQALGAVVAASIPLWNESLLYSDNPRDIPRFVALVDNPDGVPVHPDGPCPQWGSFRKYEDWKVGLREEEKNRNKTPGPDEPMKLPQRESKLYEYLKLQNLFTEQGLQVCFETITITRDPHVADSEEVQALYEWDIYGNVNEKVVASTLICLDRTNITPSSGALCFRTECSLDWSDETYADRDIGCNDVDGEPWTFRNMLPERVRPATTASIRTDILLDAVQELGTIVMPTGRMAAFSNAVHHKFSPLTLEDETKPGYCHFLAVHLVDPHSAMPSTRHIPPQSLEIWWNMAGIYKLHHLNGGLPLEILNQIVDDVLWCEPETEDERQQGMLPKKWLTSEAEATNIAHESQKIHCKIMESLQRSIERVPIEFTWSIRWIEYPEIPRSTRPPRRR